MGPVHCKLWNKQKIVAVSCVCVCFFWGEMGGGRLGFMICFCYSVVVLVMVVWGRVGQ